MPYVHLSVTEQLSEEDKQRVFARIAALMPLMPGKTYDNSMVQIDGGCFIRKGDADRCLILDIHMHNPSPEEAKATFCEAAMRMLEEELGIPAADQYVNFIELPNWGVGGRYI